MTWPKPTSTEAETPVVQKRFRLTYIAAVVSFMAATLVAYTMFL
ncbi:hypothetical protein SAMN05428988_3639 [Chitinophaga sp. YR573]|nr:hypothetical protein [Chitinophaga sp. YR573]SEW25460.1 hypothetical protein SAMN05428988_3639 [Chitinophaga sp. YR573]